MMREKREIERMKRGRKLFLGCAIAFAVPSDAQDL